MSNTSIIKKGFEFLAMETELDKGIGSIKKVTDNIKVNWWFQ